jgi:uncharacterized RDD family membrane protein YckC
MAAYYVLGDDGEEYGPVAETELREWVRENRIGLGTKVREEQEGAKWELLENVPGLKTWIEEAHAGALFPGLPQYEPAPWHLRLAAFLVDSIILSIPCVLSLTVILAFLPVEIPKDPEQLKALLTGPGTPLFWAVQIWALVAQVIYLTFFHGGCGQTPGKKLCRIRVMNHQGGNPSYVQAFGRALVASVLNIGAVLVLLLPRNQALHDLTARTYVVRLRNRVMNEEEANL